MPHSRSKCDYLSGPGWLGVTHLFFSTIPIGETWKEQKGGGQQNTHGNDTYPIPLNTVTAEGLNRTRTLNFTKHLAIPCHGHRQKKLEKNWHLGTVRTPDGDAHTVVA